MQNNAAGSAPMLEPAAPSQRKLGMAMAINKVLRRPGESLASFTHQYNQLSDSDKLELARGCAQQLGAAAEQCDFALA